MIPGFLTRLAAPSVRTVLMCGCGGGFDFVHGVPLWEYLTGLGKTVIIGSYSFGDPGAIGGPAPVVFEQDGAVARRVTAASEPDPHYGPEVHLASFLDARYPDAAPHALYAYYARAFTVPTLTAFYRGLVAAHDVDAVVLIDGGSDSLMAGDEEGLGDPLEDAVSVAAVAALDGVKERILLSVGVGADRFNHVSDAATLRAVAELTSQGGFLGVTALEPDSPGLLLYADALDHIYARQTFRSVLAGSILSTARGWYGADTVPELLGSRVQPGSIFAWPLMAMVWGFDVRAVAARSLLVDWIKDCDTVPGCYLAIARARQALDLRPVENLPPHESMRNPRGRFL